MKNKIYIVVSGGVVQDCYSDNPDLEVNLIDWDDDERESENEIAFKTAEKLNLVY